MTPGKLIPLAMAMMMVPFATCADDREIEHLANVNTDFGIRMYKLIASNAATETYGNIFFSPFSISSAFAMLHLGTNNNTRKELDDVFGFGNTIDDDDDVHAIFKALREVLNPENGYYQLDVANRLFAAENYALLESFTTDTERYYDAPTDRLNFVEKLEESRQHINSWVEDKTQDKIKDFIKPGMLDSATILVLVNAIYFKANWYKEFDAQLTSKHQFMNYLGTPIEVDMMSMDSHFLYGESAQLHAKVLEIFYDGDQASMVFMLPLQDHTLNEVAEALDHNSLRNAIDDLESKEVRVKIPRFTITQNIDLVPVLQHMGVQDAFTDAADLSRINGKHDLYVSGAFHKAFIEVNEEGTEAAAATGIVIKETSIGGDVTPEFFANQPFLFLIRHVETDSVLFMGRVGDPSVIETSLGALTGAAQPAITASFTVLIVALLLFTF